MPLCCIDYILCGDEDVQISRSPWDFHVALTINQHGVITEIRRGI